MEYVQSTRKIIKIESNDFDEPGIDELDSIIFDAIKKHMGIMPYENPVID
jgi:hypothetical protein